MSTTYRLKKDTFNSTHNQYQILYNGKDNEGVTQQDAQVEQVWYKTYTNDWSSILTATIITDSNISMGETVYKLVNIDSTSANYDVEFIEWTQASNLVRDFSFNKKTWNVCYTATSSISSGTTVLKFTYRRRKYRLDCVWRKPYRLVVNSDYWEEHPTNVTSGYPTGPRDPARVFGKKDSYSSTTTTYESGQIVYSGGFNPVYNIDIFTYGNNNYYYGYSYTRQGGLPKGQEGSQWSYNRSLGVLFPKPNQYKFGFLIDWEDFVPNGPQPNENYFYKCLGAYEQDWAQYLTLLIPRGSNSVSQEIKTTGIYGEEFRTFGTSPDDGKFEIFDINNFCNSKNLTATVQQTSSSPLTFTVTVSTTDGHFVNQDTGVIGKLWWLKNVTVPAHQTSGTSSVITLPSNAEKTGAPNYYSASTIRCYQSTDIDSTTRPVGSPTITFDTSTNKIIYNTNTSATVPYDRVFKIRMTFIWNTSATGTRYDPLVTAQVPFVRADFDWSFSSDGTDAEIEVFVPNKNPYTLRAVVSTGIGDTGVVDKITHDDANYYINLTGLSYYTSGNKSYFNELYYDDMYSESHENVFVDVQLKDAAGLMLDSINIHGYEQV